MELLTISRAKASRLCWRLHYLGYELGRVPIKTGEALFFGTLFHVGLEQWWLTWMDIQRASVEGADVPEWWCDEIEALHLTEEELCLHFAMLAMQAKFAAAAPEADAGPFDLVKAEELLRGYHYRWCDDMENIEVIAVEAKFTMPMVNPLTNRPSTTWELGGKIDVVIRYRDTGEYRVVEHKTSTEDITAGATYWTRLRMDGQVSQYMDGAKSLGFAPEGCLYDVAKRPQLQQKMETPDENKKYTIGKACKPCQEKAQAAHKEYWDSKMGGEKFKKLLVKDIAVTEGCEECDHPRLHKGQRDHDETVEEFRERLRDNIAEDPEKYFQRADVVRMDGELDEFRYDTWEHAKTLRERQLASRTLGMMAWPRNPDACFKWQRACEYYGACTGSCSINDDHTFRDKQGQHEELA